ncbi:hypothetical protein HT031_004217 [Scenedesmus sp. PABB004]|nr:hypothetical protein HT031_004217 [Scenedesmus sp. PABB004]
MLLQQAAGGAGLHQRAALSAAAPAARARPRASRRGAAAAPAAREPDAAQAPRPSAGARHPSAQECFDDMLTMLGGLDDSRLVGYAGQWATWDVSAGGAAPPALIDASVNIRLWRMTDRGAQTLKQSNLYQRPAKMAGPSTRFLPYLSGNTMEGRADGYGLREWSFGPDSDMLSPDASAWRAAPGAGERSMRVLSVPGRAATIVNGALPSGFEAGHVPPIWVLEFIVKEPGSDARRWASMAWYEHGRLAVSRSINEDAAALPDDLEARSIDPAAFVFAPRRDGELGGIERHMASGAASRAGAATAFTYGADGRLAVESAACAWSLGAAAAFAPGAPAAAPAAGGLAEQDFPDWSYSRVPRDLPALIAAGLPRVTFEAGTVLGDGSVSRWLLTYETGGHRLLESAVFEHYPAAGGGGSGEASR